MSYVTLAEKIDDALNDYYFGDNEMDPDRLVRLLTDAYHAITALIS